MGFVLLVIVLVISIMVVSLIWKAYVLSILWSWFMVSIFHLPELSIPAAIGIMTVASLIRTGSAPKKDDDQSWLEFFIQDSIGDFVGPLIVLIVGAIAHGYM